MAAEPALDPTLAREEEDEELDDDEESDIYEVDVSCRSLLATVRSR